MSKGIDYGMGQTNIDRETGIRYGVISQHAVSNWFVGEDMEADYGEPSCPECGSDAVAGDSEIPLDELQDGETEAELQEKDRDELGYKTLHHACGDYACDSCRLLFDGEDAFGDEPRGYSYDDGDVKCTMGTDGFGIWVIKSPFYTLSGFCSPCAPGAGDLDSPMEDGVKTYCLNGSFFEDGKAPYPVYSVKTGELVESI